MVPDTILGLMVGRYTEISTDTVTDGYVLHVLFHAVIHGFSWPKHPPPLELDDLHGFPAGQFFPSPP